MPLTVTTTSLQSFAAQFEFIQRVIQMNLEGITDEEAMVYPQPAGNPINWIAGHLVLVRQGLLRSFDVPPFLPKSSIEAYRRGSKPGQQPLPEHLTTLRKAIEQSYDALRSLFSRIDDDVLAAPAPFTIGGGEPDTFGSLLAKMVVHESYHSGQIGIVRRLIGKPGAIQ